MPTFDVQGALAAGHSAADIANEMGQGSGFNVEGARKAGYSDSQIISEIQPASNSYAGDLQGGAHDTMTGLSQTANALGGVANRNGYTSLGSAATTAGQFLSDHAPAAVPETPNENVGAAISSGRYSDIPGAVLHSAARALPGTAPLLAAGAIPGVGPALAGLTAGAESLGPTAYQRAANNGRSEPNTSDVEGALPSTAANAVGGAILPGGMANKIASPLLRAGAKVGLEAGAGMGMDAASQLGGSVGTDKGAQFDPAEMAGVGLTQGAIGGGREVLPIARAGIKSGADNVMSRLVDGPANLDDAQSMSRVGQAYTERLQAVQDTRGGDTQPTAVLNNLKTETFNATLSKIAELQKTGILSDEMARTAKTVLDKQALRHNNEIVDSPDTSSMFGDLKSSGIDPTVLQPVLNGIRDLNTLSKQSFLKNQTGPFQKIGNGIAQAAGVVAPLATMGPAGIPTAVGALLGHSQVGRLGGAIGGAFDSALGTKTPPILLQSIAADRYLKARGADAGAPTIASLAPGPTPPPVAAPTVGSLAQAKIDKLVRANSVNIAAADKLPTDTAHSESVAGTAAMVKALQDAARVQALAGSAPAALKDRMTVGNPAGDLTQNIGGPAQIQAGAQRPPGVPQAPPVNTAAPTPPAQPSAPSGPPPALSMTTPATQGRPWEQYVGKTLPGATRQNVYDAVDAVHSPETAAALKANMSGADAAHLQPVIEHLRSQQAPSSGTREIQMQRQWDAGKARYEDNVASQIAEARAVGLPDTSAALAEVGITKGQTAKAAIRDAHLATILDAAKRSQAAALFSKRLMEHGPQ